MRCRHFGTNLIDSFRRVQQLLVLVIFLPGISDRANQFVTSHFVEQIASRMRSDRFRRTESSRPRHTHLPRRQALGRRLGKITNTRPPPKRISAPTKKTPSVYLPSMVLPSGRQTVVSSPHQPKENRRTRPEAINAHWRPISIQPSVSPISSTRAPFSTLFS